MKKKLLLFIFFGNLISISCQTQTDLNNIKDVEIYTFKTEYRNENSYSNYKTEAEQKDLLGKYKNVSDIPVGLCAQYIDIENSTMNENPFLNNNDIERFDWKSSIIYLTSSGIQKMKELEIPLRGLPFVIKVKGKVLYDGWFWNIVSSFGCDRVWTMQFPNEKELHLKFGLGSFKCGTDPRKDESLIRKAIEEK